MSVMIQVDFLLYPVGHRDFLHALSPVTDGISLMCQTGNACRSMLLQIDLFHPVK